MKPSLRFLALSLLFGLLMSFAFGVPESRKVDEQGQKHKQDVSFVQGDYSQPVLIVDNPMPDWNMVALKAVCPVVPEWMAAIPVSGHAMLENPTYGYRYRVRCRSPN